MRVRVFDTAAALAGALARHIATILAGKPQLALGLPTGRTPIPLYRELVRLYQAGRADFSRATTFNLDEFLGLDADDSRSYRTFMQRRLFDHINVASQRVLEKVGFRREGHLRSYLVFDTERADAFIYSLLPSDLG